MKCYDIDGVLCDWTRDVFLPAGERVLGRPLEQSSEDSYDLCENLGITAAECRRIWDSNELRWAMLDAPLMNNRVGHILDSPEDHCFITARGTDGHPADQLFRVITRRWLRRQFPGDLSPIHFVPAEQKVALALELGVRSAWEDHPNTALAMAEAGIRVRMPLYGYNRHLEHRLITRVEGWREPSLFDLLAVS